MVGVDRRWPRTLSFPPATPFTFHLFSRPLVVDLFEPRVLFPAAAEAIRMPHEGPGRSPSGTSPATSLSKAFRVSGVKSVSPNSPQAQNKRPKDRQIRFYVQLVHDGRSLCPQRTEAMDQIAPHPWIWAVLQERPDLGGLIHSQEGNRRIRLPVRQRSRLSSEDGKSAGSFVSITAVRGVNLAHHDP